MSFLIQRSAGRGLTLSQVNTAALRIGRGTNQELRSENPAVALEHAVIESDAAGYLITDKGSITGTYVNRKPVETARLSKGDVIEIGDLRIEVQIAEPGKPLFLRVGTAVVATTFVEEDEAANVEVAPGARVVKAKKIDYVGAYRLARPWLTKLTITSILLIAALAIIGEVIRPEKQAAFMPGGVSSAHARTRTPEGQRVATKCDACHTPWNSVAARKCEACHAQGPHAAEQASMKDPDCFACHAEHRDQRTIAPIDDRTCVGCHGKLNPRVTAFGAAHPELTYARDANTLRFNHRLHLNAKGIFNATGRREVLQCNGCHEMQTVRDKIDPVALKFEQHCQRCHLLTFDPRLPNAQIPHGGDAGTALGYLIGVYSGERDLAGKSSVEVRRILATRNRANADVGAVIRARQQFRFKCQKCHVVEQRGADVGVTRPHIPPRWLVRATFTHGPHLKDACEHCHRGVRESASTADVLMPRRAECIDCHGANAKVQQAASTCRTCHEYHFRPRRQIKSASLVQAGMGGLGGGGRMLQGILLAVIVILLLVVLVPVGIALFQRLRPERSVSAPPPTTPKPAPPPRPSVDVPTDKVSRQPNAPPPDMRVDLPPTDVRPAVRIETPGEETRVEAPLPKNEPVGTEMVQWNGLLHCTSGPLEGQRFIIEDEGLYIGRDPALAKIVIPDTRVSKRHLRIVPRDGKVWAIDQGSTNGTYLRDQRITEVQLKRGDTLVLGDNAATFVYQI